MQGSNFAVVNVSDGQTIQTSTASEVPTGYSSASAARERFGRGRLLGLNHDRDYEDASGKSRPKPSLLSRIFNVPRLLKFIKLTSCAVIVAVLIHLNIHAQSLRMSIHSTLEDTRPKQPHTLLTESDAISSNQTRFTNAALRALAARTVISIPQPLKHLGTSFRHPYHMLYLTRRCHSPCSFITQDPLKNRSFTQVGMDHLWLSQEDMVTLEANPSLINAFLAEDTFEAIPASQSSTGANTIVVIPYRRFQGYPSDPLIDKSFVGTPIPLTEGYMEHPMELNQRKALQIRGNNPHSFVVGYGSKMDLQINYVSHVYADFNDFEGVVKLSRANSSSPRSWGNRYKGMVAFTPPCNQLHPGAIYYIARLMRLFQLNVYGGCLANKVLGDGQILNANRKARLAQAHRFVLVWETTAELEGFVTENFFHSLSFNSVLVVWGPRNVDKFLPHPKSAIKVRDFSDSPEKLAQRLKEISEKEDTWNEMMSWRDNPSESVWEKSRFRQLWTWSVDKAVCSICSLPFERNN